MDGRHADIPNHRDRRLAIHVVPHEAALRRWLRGFSALGEPDIDDLIQEAYATQSMRDSVDAIVDPRSYAFQVAKSLFLQGVRRAKIVSISTGADLASLDVPGEAPSPFQHAAGREDLERVAEAIRAMPPQTRRAFWTRRVEELSQREIATATAPSENTVEKHTARGKNLDGAVRAWRKRGSSRIFDRHGDPFEGMDDALGSPDTNDRSLDRKHYQRRGGKLGVETRSRAGEAEQEALDAWLSADVRRIGALARARAIWSLAEMGLAQHEVPVGPVAPRLDAEDGLFTRRRMIAGGIAAACASVALVPLLRRWSTLSSGIGEVRSIGLEDGSTGPQ